MRPEGGSKPLADVDSMVVAVLANHPRLAERWLHAERVKDDSPELVADQVTSNLNRRFGTDHTLDEVLEVLQDMSDEQVVDLKAIGPVM